MKSAIVIVGGGGHAKVLADTLSLLKMKIEGFVDIKSKEFSLGKNKIKYLGTDKFLLKNYDPRQIKLVNGIGSVGDTTQRKRVFDFFKIKGYAFETVVHPRAFVSPNARLGEGAQIMAGAIIQADSLIGTNSIVNTRASVDHDCQIGEHVHLAPAVTLSGGVQIGHGTHVGTGATVRQGIRIGRGCFVHMGCAVLANLPDRRICKK